RRRYSRRGCGRDRARLSQERLSTAIRTAFVLRQGVGAEQEIIGEAAGQVARSRPLAEADDAAQAAEEDQHGQLGIANRRLAADLGAFEQIEKKTNQFQTGRVPGEILAGGAL